MVDDYPPLPRGWKTANMMKAEHGGHDQVWNDRMRNFATFLANEIALEKDISIREAKKIVEEQYAGMRRNISKNAFALSPEAQDMLLSMLPPKLEENWRTANSMHNELGISDELLGEHFKNLEQKLIGDTQENLDIGYQEAKQLIHHNVIGDRRPKRGPSSLAAGPDAQRLILEEISPNLPKEWLTPSMMSEKHGHGNEKLWKQRFSKLAETLPEQISGATGMPLNKAIEHVDQTMVGLRTPSGGGIPVISVSPDAEAILVKKYVSKDRSR